MGKGVIAIIVILVLIIATLFYLVYSAGILDIVLSKSSSGNTTITSVKYNVTKENLVPFLESQQFVKDMPNDAVILLKLFDTDTGEKEWGENYVIKKSNVEQTQLKGSPDITINIDSKYLSTIGQDFCGTLKTAKNNGEMYTETDLSTTKLMWKFKSMLKYRDCLGI